MLRELLKVADLPDDPLKRLSDHMKWKIEFSSADITELKKFIQIMEPMERLFCQLNSEKDSTLHLVYPIVKDMLESLVARVEDPGDSAHVFAKELKKQLEDQFCFLLDPHAVKEKFQPIYWLASFLSPVHRQALSDDVTMEAKTFLKSRFTLLAVQLRLIIVISQSCSQTRS